jgi:putative transposase
MIPLANGKILRKLDIIDDFNREDLSITVDTSLPSQRVIGKLETLVEWRGRPDPIYSDNGPEFISEALSQWYKKSGVEWVFIQPGKPAPNSLIEWFKRPFRRDILDSSMYKILTELRKYS